MTSGMLKEKEKDVGKKRESLLSQSSEIADGDHSW